MDSIPRKDLILKKKGKEEKYKKMRMKNDDQDKKEIGRIKFDKKRRKWKKGNFQNSAQMSHRPEGRLSLKLQSQQKRTGTGYVINVREYVKHQIRNRRIKVYQTESHEKIKTIAEICQNESEQFYPEEEEEEEEISQEYNEYNIEKVKHMDLNSYNENTYNLWYNTDYIEDIIYHEMHKESLYQLSGNFCRKYDINPTGREILIDWLISVQVSVKAENSVLHLAVALLDILLDSMHVPLSGMQAAAIAAFWVAYKFTHGSISMKTLLSFCAGTVTKTMIRENEILVLQTSRLIETGGSVTVFFNYLLYNIFGVKFPPEIYYCGLYFIEIMLLQFMFVDCAAYEKAVTAVFSALCVFGGVSQFDLVDVSRFITKRRLQQVYRRLMRSLKLMYYDKSALKNSSVYIKYKSSRYYRISIHQNLKYLATA